MTNQSVIECAVRLGKNGVFLQANGRLRFASGRQSI